MWLFDLLSFLALKQLIIHFLKSQYSDPVDTSDHPAGDAMLSWPTKEACEVFEDSEFYKIKNIFSIVIITEVLLRTCF